MEVIKPYVLCGGTALSVQLDHRLSEDLDFMMWRESKKEKPEVKWPAIKRELENKKGEIQNFDIYDFGQVEFVVCIKISISAIELWIAINYCIFIHSYNLDHV